MIKALVTGVSGMVGRAILGECLASDDVEKVLMINRKTINISHPKLSELVVEDFADLPEFKEQLQGFNACFLSIGSLTTFGEKTYENVNYHIPVAFAKTVLHANPDISICYVSGAGADSTESSPIMQLRIKGKTENALLDLGFKSAFMLRPAVVIPQTISELKFLYKIFYSIIKPFHPVIFKMNLAVESYQIGRAMINVIKNNYTKNILETRDIARLSSQG